MIVFDIETGPLPEETLRGQCPPFEPPEHPGEFNPSAVRCGNIGGPDSEKGQAKIAKARDEHEATVAKYSADVDAAKAAHWQDFLDKAALSPLTGRVLAIGYQLPNGRRVIHHHEANDQEPGMLSSFWQIVQKAIKQREKVVGHNIEGFDLPFLLRSSWLYRIDVPDEIFDGRYWNRCFLDTMRRWQCGNYREQFAKLDTLAKAFGLGGKLEDGGVSGAEFSKFYWGSPEERALALQYLEKDVELTAAIASKMGVI